MAKFLILTASPTRDEIVDILIKEELEKFGHQVSVRPCLREGRSAIVDELNKLILGEENPFIPDTVVVPPIRNPYSRDLVAVLKNWGLGVVSRHTEPSCDMKDFEKIVGQDKKDKTSRAMEILGRYKYEVDCELVWSKDEAEILNTKRKYDFKTHSVGALTVDAYMRQDKIDKYKNIEEFRKKFNFDEKPVLLVCSAWGFVDTAPDLHIDEVNEAKKDIEGMNRHLEMIKKLDVLRKDWNILVTTHPGVIQEPYQDVCKKMSIPLDTESTSFYLKVHVDAFIHAGSTMAIGAHFLNKPAYQFGDINTKNANNWWADPESAISRISPYFKTPEELIEAINSYKPETNANSESLKELEEGRFGLMDGQATVRAAAIIDKVRGQFKFCWPKSSMDYSQLTLMKEERRLFTPITCGICGEEMAIVNESWTTQATQNFFTHLKDYLKGPIPPDVIQKIWAPPHGDACPHCGARFFRQD